MSEDPTADAAPLADETRRVLDELESLVSQFRDVLHILQDDEAPPAERIARMRASLNDDPGNALNRCNEHIAYTGNHAIPFLLAPYRNLRSLLFQCLDILSLRSSSQDDALLGALAWIQQYRASRREYLLLGDADLAELPSRRHVADHDGKWLLVAALSPPQLTDNVCPPRITNQMVTT